MPMPDIAQLLSSAREQFLEMSGHAKAEPDMRVFFLAGPYRCRGFIEDIDKETGKATIKVTDLSRAKAAGVVLILETTERTSQYVTIGVSELYPYVPEQHDDIFYAKKIGRPISGGGKYIPLRL